MGLSPKLFCGTEGAGMVRTCIGPVADRETGSEECRMGGGLEVTCPDCYSAGHESGGYPLQCPICDGTGRVLRCDDCEAKR